MLALASPPIHTINNNVPALLQSVLGWLGFQDPQPEIAQAALVEQALSRNLSEAYAGYTANKNNHSARDLQHALASSIEQLERDYARALERATQEGSDRTSIPALFGFGMAKHYQTQADKIAMHLKTLRTLRDDVIFTHEHSTQRRLLQDTSLAPPVTETIYCAPAGTCELAQICDGVSGFVLQGNYQDNSGIGIHAAGDINGDGLADIMVDTYNVANGPGKFYVLFGSNRTSWANGVLNLTDFMDGQRGFSFQGPTRDMFSSTVGDINGDGLADFAVGFPLSSLTYVFLGSKSSTAWGNGTLGPVLLNGVRGFTLRGDVSAKSGTQVGSAGDINGDGIADFLVGAPGSNSDAGRAYVIFGTNYSLAWIAGTLNLTSLANGVQGFALQEEAGGAFFGSSVSAVGDMNGDGLADFMVSAPFANSSLGQLNAGKTYVIFGTKNASAWGSGVVNMSQLMDGKRGFVMQGATGDRLGYSVKFAGDINGDGLADLMITAASSSTGALYIVFGSNLTNAWGSGLLNMDKLILDNHAFTFRGVPQDFYTTTGANTAGDINRDGFADVMLGAPTSSTLTGLPYVGKAAIFLGSSLSSTWGARVSLDSLLNGVQGFVLRGELTSDYAGWGVSTLGDFNGDGLPDLGVGAPFAGASAGKSYILLSNVSRWYFTANNLRLSADQTIQLSLRNLNIANDHASGNPVLIIQSTEQGYFTLISNVGKVLKNFTLQELSMGQIQFIHTGHAVPPKYRICVGGMSLSTQACSDVQVNFLAYPPNLINAQLTVNQGSPVIVQASDLSVSDPDDSPSQLSFFVDNITYGEFLVYDTPNTSSVRTVFTQQELLNGQVSFVHNGSRHKPSFTVLVNDSKSATLPQAAIIKFNFAPELNLTNSMITLDQGQGTTLNPGDISASDVETFRESIIIEIANVTSGHFAYTSNPNVSITDFQQLSLTTGNVQFIQNGGNTAPSFALRAFDGTIRSPWQTVRVYLNRRPVLQGEASAQTVLQGKAFSFALSSMRFSELDANDTLTYHAQLRGVGTGGGSPLPPEIQFTPPVQFSGNLPSVGSFDIEVTASDSRGLKTSTNFILSSRAAELAGINLDQLYTALSTIGGVGVTVLAYLWLRKRIAKHRRDFPFANDLRKVLNLAYYDFTRFDGDAYKTKVDNFVQNFHGFYARLTPQEQKSFAVCVAEILTTRGLVSPSTFSGGLFGVCCLLNVGWPSELHLQAFEAQSSEIAAEAVFAWKSANVATEEHRKPVSRWPYYSPSKKEKCRVFCCCQRPSSAGRWHAEEGVALAELRNRSEDVELPMEARDGGDHLRDLASLKEQVRTLNERLRRLERTGNEPFLPVH